MLCRVLYFLSPYLPKEVLTTNGFVLGRRVTVPRRSLNFQNKSIVDNIGETG